MVAAHAERVALGREVDGLGYWVAFTGADQEEFVGLTREMWRERNTDSG